MKIIINADDFGLDSARNVAISDAFQKGLCTQTSLIMNTSGCEEAVLMSREYGFFDRVCLHLNLTVGKPLTENIKYIDEFCTEGVFNGKFHHSVIGRFTKKHSDIVAKEIEAQIIKYINYGFTMRHVDSHHWVQLDRKVSDVMNKLILKYGFVSIRKGENIVSIRDSDIIKQKKTYLHFSRSIMRYNRSIRKLGLITADYIGKIQNIGKYSPNIWNTAHKDATIEFITHPIYKDGVLFDKGVAPLEDMINLLRGKEHSFITYNELLLLK